MKPMSRLMAREEGFAIPGLCLVARSHISKEMRIRRLLTEEAVT
jgi:hypothetical protein